MSAFDGRSSMMTQSRAHKEAQVQALHAKTFGAWINSHLRHRSLRVNDLSQDLRDGLLLIQLVEQLSGTTCELKYNKSPTLPMHLIDNQAVALRYLSQFLKLNIEPKDLAEGNLKVTLNLIWRLILHFQVFHSAGLAGGGAGAMTGADGQPLDASSPASRKLAQDALLRWIQYQTHGYKDVAVADYTSSFNDGMALCALVHRFCPTAIDYQQITPSRPYDNLRLAFTLAAQHLDIPILIDPADMVNPDPSLRPDENCMVTYLSQFPAAVARYQQKQQQLQQMMPLVLPPPTPISATPPPATPTPIIQIPQPIPATQLPPPPQPQPPPMIMVEETTTTTTTTTTSSSGAGGPVIILDVTVIEARGLSTVGAFQSRPHPYAVLTCYRQKEKTKKHHSELNPKWNADFTFYVEDPTCLLLVEVFSWDRFLAHDFLGQVEVPLSAIALGRTEEEWFPLTGKRATGRVAGEIALRFNRR